MGLPLCGKEINDAAYSYAANKKQSKAGELFFFFTLNVAVIPVGLRWSGAGFPACTAATSRPHPLQKTGEFFCRMGRGCWLDGCVNTKRPPVYPAVTSKGGAAPRAASSTGKSCSQEQQPLRGNTAEQDHTGITTTSSCFQDLMDFKKERKSKLFPASRGS